MNEFDVVVVGAGAAGLLAAARSAERGLRTVLLEKNRKPGVKILMSGGSRCNLTQNTDARGIVQAFGRQGRFLHSALSALGPADLVALVAAEGVRTKIESTGKIFPASDKAADILRAFTDRLSRSGCAVHLARAVTSLVRSIRGWQLETVAGPVTASHVVVAVGGKSYPGCGTTGDAYAWLSALGHTIIPTRPALVPLTSDAGWIRELAGVTIPDVALAIVPRDDLSAKPIEVDARPPVDRGSFLFTHRGVSGPAVLNVSRGVTAQTDPATVQLRCDFLPGFSTDDFDRVVRERTTAAGRKGMAGLFDDLLPHRLVEALLQKAAVPLDQRGTELSRERRTSFIAAVKRCEIPLTGSLGFAKAEVTAGGVSLAEVDSRTMQSRLHPGLFLAGEVLDLDGPIGGYNFQAAFSTAWLAAERLEIASL